MSTDDFHRCLETLDVAGIRVLWARVYPGLEQPQDDAMALVTLHMARTAAETIDIKLRAYSHAWLGERGYRSLLPDRLKADADRLYPRVVEAVGVSVNFTRPELRPAGDMIRGAMEVAVLDAAAQGRLGDAEFVRTRMAEARAREERALFGRGLPVTGG